MKWHTYQEIINNNLQCELFYELQYTKEYDGTITKSRISTAKFPDNTESPIKINGRPEVKRRIFALYFGPIKRDISDVPKELEEEIIDNMMIKEILE